MYRGLDRGMVGLQERRERLRSVQSGPGPLHINMSSPDHRHGTDK